MSADRELLEDAAKAAGLKPPMPMHGPGLTWGHGWWNPLVDSGEALELAVTLGLRVHKTTSSVEIDIYKDGAWADTVEEKIEHDPLATTGRAIVRAAAEIGRTKE